MVISSPGHPGKYPNNAYCSWAVSVGAGSSLAISCQPLAIKRGDTLTLHTPTGVQQYTGIRSTCHWFALTLDINGSCVYR